jgi:hypothetical protein
MQPKKRAIEKENLGIVVKKLPCPLKAWWKKK